MRFNNLLILLLLVGTISCTEKRGEADNISASAPSIAANNKIELPFIFQDSLKFEPNNGLVYYRGELFSGNSKSFYSNGHVATENQYHQGKKHGYFKKYFTNSTISYHASYLDGKKNGTSKSWWSNANLRSVSNFSKGKPNGSQRQWYKSGAKFKILNLVNGLEEGKQQSWRENGKVYCNYEAINGRIFGLKRANLCYKLDDEEVQSAN